MPRRRRRLGSVTAAAVMALVYGGLNLMGGLGGLFALSFDADGGGFFGGPDELVKFQKDINDNLDGELPSKKPVAYANSIFSIPEGLLFLLGGIGLLGMRPWARHLVIVMALLSLILSVAQGVYMAAWVAPARKRAFQTAVDDVKKARAAEAARAADPKAAVQPLQPFAQDISDEEIEIVRISFVVEDVSNTVMSFLFAVYLAILVVLLIRPSIGRALAAPALADFDDDFDDHDSRRRDDDEGRDRDRRDDDDRPHRHDDRRDDPFRDNLFRDNRGDERDERIR